MIVGTAGHIDHGKTTLVRALTGVDTDRLKEEKARGISIELGYAYAPITGGADAGAQPADVMGIIDVPGHEKFVHTMAAGASGIDHVLLVVAADDGVMPQTREHLAIVELFGISQGTVALTKADRVDAARLAAVRAEVAALLAASPWPGLRDAPMFETAVAPDGGTMQGVDALRTHLHAQSRDWQARQQHRGEGLFRLAVDRVFTLAGHGTVVTGTVFGGSVSVGDVLTHSGHGSVPARPVRVRSLHAQNRAAETGVAGQRVALNLTGVDRQDIARGDWIADARVLQATSRIDARVRLLHDASPLASWTLLHVHLGAAHRQAHAVPLQADTLAPGGEGLVQLVFDAPVFVVPGDRFILRNAQGTRTVGGGMVLDPLAPERRRRSAERMRWLDAMQLLATEGDARPLLAAAPAGLTRSALARLMGRWPEASWVGEDDAVAFSLRQRAAAPSSAASSAALPAREAGADILWLAPPVWAGVRAHVVEALNRHHARAPDEPGLNSARLQRMAFPAQSGAQATLAQVPPAVWQAWIDRLLAEGEPVVERTGQWLHRPGHRVTLNEAERTLSERLLPLLAAGGNDPPWVRDLARSAGTREDAVRELLRKQARLGVLYQVVKDLFYPAERVAELANVFAELAAQARGGGGVAVDAGAGERAGAVETQVPEAGDERGAGIAGQAGSSSTQARGPVEASVRRAGRPPHRLPQGAVEARVFRDAVQLGRKRAIQILEFFDRIGYTRRVGDAHLLRPDTRWTAEGPAVDHRA